MPTKETHSLFRADYCKNGHDIRDKSMIYEQKSKGKVTGYACRACLAVSVANYKAKKGIVHKPRSANALRLTPVVTSLVVTKDNPVMKSLLARIERASEIELLEIALFVAKLIPDTE